MPLGGQESCSIISFTLLSNIISQVLIVLLSLCCKTKLKGEDSMKKFPFIFAVSLIAVIISADTFAKGPFLPLSKTVKLNAESNLLVGLASDNFGLKTSSAYMLGELQSTRAVLPLMKILHTDLNDDARIMAALALYKIGDARGLYAVKQAIRFDDSERVSKLCIKFYNAYVNKEIAEALLVASQYQ